jgi:hypothetical protein
MTINQFILIFKDLAERHKQINHFIVSEDYDLGTVDSTKFPLLAIIPSGASLPSSDNGYSIFSVDFAVKVVDLANDNKNNVIEVYSDSVEILKDIVNEYVTHPFYLDSGITLTSDVSMDKLTEFTDSDLYGYGTTLTFETPNKVSHCTSPITAI